MSLRKNQAENTYTYFDYSLKHNWQHLIFYIILALLVVVLPTVVTVGDYAERNFTSYDSALNYADELMVVSAVLTFVTSCATAVFAGMSALSYVNSKQAVGCFHSFPITRKTLYLTETAVRGLYYLAAISIAVVISWSLLEMNMHHTPEIRLFYVQMLILSLLAFALFYSIALFAAGLTGTPLLRFLLFGLIVVLPIAVYALICWAASLGMPNVHIDRYLNFNFVKWLCPVTFLADIVLTLAGESSSGAPLGFGVSVVLTILPTIAFYLGGFVLHLKRRSEASGNSIIWKPVFMIIKYVVMFVASVCGLLFFGALSDGDVAWYFFGGLCGLVMSFILANVILYRSVRAMFKGVRGLCVMAVVMVLFSVFTVYDAAGLNDFVWSAANTKSLTVRLNGVEVTYTDGDDIDVIVPLIREQLENKYFGEYNGQYEAVNEYICVDEKTAEDVTLYLRGAYDGKYDYEYDYNYDEYGYPVVSENGYAYKETVQSSAWIIATEEYVPTITTSSEAYYMYWDQLPYVGIPLYKSMDVYNVERSQALLDYIVSSEEYAAVMNQSKALKVDDVYEINIRLFEHYSGFRIGDAEYVFKRIMEIYDFNADYRDSPSVGQIRIWDTNGYTLLPIYAADLELVNLASDLLNLKLRFDTADEVYVHLAENTEVVLLVEMSTGRIISLDEAAQAEVYGMLPRAYNADYSITVPSPAFSMEYAVVMINGTPEQAEYTYLSTPVFLACEAEAAKLIK